MSTADHHPLLQTEDLLLFISIIPLMYFVRVTGKTGFFFSSQCKVSFNIDKYLINTKCEDKINNLWPLNSARIQKSKAEAAAQSQRQGGQMLIAEEKLPVFQSVCVCLQLCTLIIVVY